MIENRKLNFEVKVTGDEYHFPQMRIIIDFCHSMRPVVHIIVKETQGL